MTFIRYGTEFINLNESFKRNDYDLIIAHSFLQYSQSTLIFCCFVLLRECKILKEITIHKNLMFS